MMKKLIAAAALASAMIASPAMASECCKGIDPSHMHTAADLERAIAADQGDAKTPSKGAERSAEYRIVQAKKMKAYMAATAGKTARRTALNDAVKCSDCRQVKVAANCTDCTECDDCEVGADCDSGQCSKTT